MTVLNLADALRVGGSAVDKVYAGADLVWPMGGGGPTGYAAEVLADAPLIYWRLNDPFTTITATSSTSFGSEPPSGAFDLNPGTYWTTSGATTGWLRAQLSVATALNAYAIRRRDDIPGRNPKDWTFEGSQDGISWTALDSQAGVTWPTAAETKTFTFANTTAYLYYRLNITANSGAATYLSVAELSLGAVAEIADASGNGRSGEAHGSMPESSASLLSGDTDRAAFFSGTAGIRVAGNPSLTPSAFTAEALIKPSAVSGTRVVMSRQGTSVNSATFTFRLEGAALKFYCWTSSTGFQTITASTTIAAGATYHAVAVHTGTRLKIYVNGTEVADAAATNAPHYGAPTSLRVGRSEPGEFFVGVIDEVAYYGTALSADRIAAHNAAR